VFPFKPRVSIGFQGVHSFNFSCVRTLHVPSLACYAGHTLATNKDILLASTHNYGQGDTIRSTIGTATPNGLRSSWDFLPGRSPDMLAGPTPSTPTKQVWTQMRLSLRPNLLTKDSEIKFAWDPESNRVSNFVCFIITLM